MKGFGKIALVLGLLGVMAYFIIPLQSTRSRALSPTDKAEYVWTVSNYKRYCGPVAQNIEEQAKAYAGEWARRTFGQASTPCCNIAVR
jgi:hypothetical protein